MATAHALTSRGFEQVRTFHNQLTDVKALAKWLCQVEHAHDRDYDPQATRSAEFDAFDQQVCRRGYCDECRDFAARLLVFQGRA